MDSSRLIRSLIWAGMVFVPMLTGCAGMVPFNAPVRPPTMGLIVDMKAPLELNVKGNPAGTAVKKVSFERTMYFHDWIFTGLDFAWDDAKIAAIARNGGIEEISYADYELLNILGVYAQFTINVYGN